MIHVRVFGVFITLTEAKIGVKVNPDEIVHRPFSVRPLLSDVHDDLQTRSGHGHHTLNVTAADLAAHTIPIREVDRSFLKDKGPMPLLSVNMTNPSPITLPVRDLVDNVLFGGDNVLPTIVPNQKGALPFMSLPRGPLQNYCQYQECTTAGEISRNIGTQMVRMFQTSVPGIIIEKTQANVHALEYASKRGLLTPNSRTTRSYNPSVDLAQRVQKDVLNKAFVPELDRSLSQMAEKTTRVLLWNNLELINPPDQRRRAQLMARAEARNALACRLSVGLLPGCRYGQDQKEIPPAEPLDDEDMPISDEDPEAGWDEADDLTQAQNETLAAVRGREAMYGGTEGFRLRGVQQSCALQAGCRINHDLPPSIFDGIYLGEVVDDRLVFRNKLPSAIGPVNELYLVADVVTKIKERSGWRAEAAEASFAALVLPNSPDLNLVLSARLPFLYLEANLTHYELEEDFNTEDDVAAEEVDEKSDPFQEDRSGVSIFDPVNWGRPWMDWRLAQSCFNPLTCFGIFDIKRKLCVVPIVVRMEPFP